MKTLITTSLSLIFFVATLTGCTEEDAKTVEWYEGHPKERVAKLAECAQKGVVSEGCANAQLATHNNSAETPVTDW